MDLEKRNEAVEAIMLLRKERKAKEKLEAIELKKKHESDIHNFKLERIMHTKRHRTRRGY